MCNALGEYNWWWSNYILYSGASRGQCILGTNTMYVAGITHSMTVLLYRYVFIWLREIVLKLSTPNSIRANLCDNTDSVVLAAHPYVWAMTWPHHDCVSINDVICQYFLLLPNSQYKYKCVNFEPIPEWNQWNSYGNQAIVPTFPLASHGILISTCNERPHERAYQGNIPRLTLDKYLPIT